MQTSTNVNAASVETAGAVMETDLPNQSGILTTDGSGGIGVVASNSYVSSEDDPEVGDVSSVGKWCVSDGSAVQCNQDAPVLQSDLGTGSNQVVQLQGTMLPAVDGSQLTNLNLSSPGEIGSTTPNNGTFSSLRLDDGSTNYLTLRAPSLSDDTTSYTFPATPVDGQYLMSDASGNLSWSNPSAANASAISSNDTDIATNAANISGNDTDIATNAGNISSNTSALATAVMDADFASNGFLKRSGSGTYAVSASIATSDISDEAVTSGKLSSTLQSRVSEIENATNANTVSQLVKRDASGSFAAGTITANITGNVSGSAASFTGNLTGDVSGGQGATVVNSIGDGATSAASIATSVADTQAATVANTANTIVKRDANGDINADELTVNGLTVNGDITATGLISTNSPLFVAFNTQDLTADGVVKPFDMLQNVGGGTYSETNGTYTCPVTGLYDVHYWGMVKDKSINLRIRVNGVELAMGYVGTFDTNWLQIGVRDVVNCNAGEVIDIYFTELAAGSILHGDTDRLSSRNRLIIKFVK